MKIGGKFVKIREKQKGLSLIEMTIAIAILVVALLSALILATFGLVAGGESQMRVVAINLAREGVEVVRNIRDSNWLAGNDWTKDIITGNSISIFNVTNNNWTLGTNSSISNLVIDPEKPETIQDASTQVLKADELYVQRLLHVPGEIKTNFYRLIKIVEITSKISPDHELKVTCYVVWEERGRWHLVNVEDHLFNWY